MAFHLYDPMYGGVLSVHDTLEGAIDAGNEDIKENHSPSFGEEWALDMDGIAVYEAPAGTSGDDILEDGKMVARAVEVDIVHRPDDCDPDGYSESTGDYWGSGYDYTCNYAVRALSPASPISRSKELRR